LGKKTLYETVADSAGRDFDGLDLKPVPLDMPTDPALYDTFRPSEPLDTALELDQLEMYQGALFFDDGEGRARGVPAAPLPPPYADRPFFFVHTTNIIPTTTMQHADTMHARMRISSMRAISTVR
jgi:hypothetical protein